MMYSLFENKQVGFYDQCIYMLYIVLFSIVTGMFLSIVLKKMIKKNNIENYG